MKTEGPKLKQAAPEDSPLLVKNLNEATAQQTSADAVHQHLK
jgi:hypothetical protein